MKNLKIGTWNIKNSYFKIEENAFKNYCIGELLRSEDLDILCLQEVNFDLLEKIKKSLKRTDYSVPTIDKPYKLGFRNVITEKNVIITRLNHEYWNEDNNLPYLPKKFSLKTIPTIRERNITRLGLGKENLMVFNTHLDYAVDELGKRQMDEVIRFLGIMRGFYERDFILMGNLNSKPNHLNMLNFTEELEDFNMKVLNVSTNTYNNHDDNLPVDYIIVPNSYMVDELKTVNNFEKASSHYPVIAKVKR